MDRSVQQRAETLARNVQERQIVCDQRWLNNVAWGKPRPGHPEGVVLLHVVEVLDNLDLMPLTDGERAQLRLVALIHDTFKSEVDITRARTGENHHAMIARRFAEQMKIDDVLCEIIELHDEAFNAWRTGARDGRWPRAGARADALIARLGQALDLYVMFYLADNATGDKQQDSLKWLLDRIDTYHAHAYDTARAREMLETLDQARRLSTSEATRPVHAPPATDERSRRADSHDHRTQAGPPLP